MCTSVTLVEMQFNYIISYTDNVVTLMMSFTVHAKQKPWLTDFLGLLRVWDATFRAGETAVLATATANLSRGIRRKTIKQQKIHFTF